MNYEETLEKIHGFQKFGSRLGLERMNVLLKLLGNPERQMRVIHVAGTNGKGSVCRYLTAVLEENGYKVGLYTSPYLERFTERIEFDGKEISEQDLVDCAAIVFEKVDEMLSGGSESPTEFELVTAMAFVYFSRKPMDFLVLEVGLGGRGDSTNVIERPIASVITSISYDHTDVLGETLTEIAGEKAGIIKQGCPVISSVREPEAQAVIRQTAAEKKCPFYDSTKTVISEVVRRLEGYSFRMTSETETREIELGMLGMHQIENAVCALTALEVLEKANIIKTDPVKVRNAMKKARNNGRLEILAKDPLILIDGAHNEGGAEALAGVIAEHFQDKRVLIIFGVLADKKVDLIIERLIGLNADIAATEPDNPRKLSSGILAERVRTAGHECIDLGGWESACDYAAANRENYDVILFSGSLYLIGRVRERFINEVK